MSRGGTLRALYRLTDEGRVWFAPVEVAVRSGAKTTDVARELEELTDQGLVARLSCDHGIALYGCAGVALASMGLSILRALTGRTF